MVGADLMLRQQRTMVLNLFVGDSKQAASQTIAYIKKAFLNRLPNLAWLDDETRKTAVEKVVTVYFQTQACVPSIQRKDSLRSKT